MTDQINPKHIESIRSLISDPDFAMTLRSEWGSDTQDHRVKIREHLATADSAYFSRQQQIELYNLLQRPQPAQGSISISHCRILGGYTYSRFESHGFDVEEVRRISEPVLIRTSTENERDEAPHLKFLWVAKEAAWKSIASAQASTQAGPQSVLITDLMCSGWQQVSSDIWSYTVSVSGKGSSEGAIKAAKRGVGFVFSNPILLFGVYFST